MSRHLAAPPARRGAAPPSPNRIRGSSSGNGNACAKQTCRTVPVPSLTVRVYPCVHVVSESERGHIELAREARMDAIAETIMTSK